ncbi:PEP-CTERM putative exosortase interaction domain-containing protein [Opitutaceae bacterium TAV1]|nr:PEP-CTERM putative exosortase interaction domain-containing protein [Opitutaceae bacterium TAV1]
MKTNTTARALSLFSPTLAALLLPLASSAAEAVVFTESFESPSWILNSTLDASGSATATSYGSWYRGNLLTTATIGNTYTSEGSQALHVAKTGTGNGGAVASLALGNSVSQGYIEFDFRSDNGAAYLRLGDSTGATQLTFAISTNLILIPSDNSTTRSIAPGTAGYISQTWTKFRIDFDASTDSATASINGNPLTGLSFTGIAINDIAQVSLVAGSGNNSTAFSSWFDNIKLVNTAASIPEPSTWAAICGAIGLGLAAIVHRRRRS